MEEVLIQVIRVLYDHVTSVVLLRNQVEISSRQQSPLDRDTYFLKQSVSEENYAGNSP